MNCNHCTPSLHQSGSCTVCTHASCGCNSFPSGQVCSSVRSVCEHEPEAPLLSLGSRVLWPPESQHILGTIRWIGRIPQICPDWSAGVEFDEPVCSGGNGMFNGRRYFFCPNGHSLFLPISDLINNEEVQADIHVPKNESTISCGCRHTCCNSNSYHYISRPRDATYGHFRHNCYPLCSRDDYQVNARCCEHVPIYGKISSRRSLYHEDHPYESYITRPVAENVPERKVYDHNYEDAGQNFSLAVDVARSHSPSCYTEYSTVPRLKGKKTSNRLESSYSDCVMPDIRIPHREPLFVPWGPIRLISGLKDWVSCWVLGTARRKKRKKYFIQGSKTVTSVVVAASPVAGERLSALSQYSDTRYKLQNCGTAPNTIDLIKVQGNNGSAKSPANSGRKVHQKKRPAPLPPCHVDSEHPIELEENKSALSNVKNAVSHMPDEATCQNNPGTSQLSSSTKQEYIKRGKISKQENRPVLPAKTGKALATKSAFIKRQTKKRPAPLPPVPSHGISPEKHLVKAGSSSTYKTLNINHLNENAVHIIQQTQVQHVFNEANAESLSDNILLDGANRKSVVANILQTNPYVSETDGNNANINFSRLIDSMDFFDKSSNSESENNSESRGASISLSGDESEEEPMKWIGNGIISYQNDDECRRSNAVVDHNMPGDVCLKISIQKTETNVMTVERMSLPENVQQNDNSCHSSLAETSDDENNGNQTNVPSIQSSSSGEFQEEKENKLHEISKPKLKLPQKNSVKSLVEAFNMLAEKNSSGEDRNSKMAKHCMCNDKLENSPGAAVLNGNSVNLSCLKSFPTTWQYQTNGTSNYCHLNNHHLMPIAEESHTEVSEQDAHSSVDELDIPQWNDKKKSKQKHQTECRKNALLNTLQENSTAEKFKESDSTNKSCSHCSEQHKNKLSAESGQSTVSKKDKKKTGVSRPSIFSRSIVKNEMPGNLSTPNGHVIRASEAALSALLTGKPFNAVDLSTEDKGAKSKITQSLHQLKPVPKHEQPIMASLYIEDKSSHRGPIPFLVTPSMSLKKLKKKVEKQYKFPKELQCWVLGETFAIQDDSSLASYGVTEPACPLLLYVMATESKGRSLPNRASRRPVKHPIYDDVSLTSSDSDSDSISNKSSRKGSLFDSDSDHKTSDIGAQILAARNRSPKPRCPQNANNISKTAQEKPASTSQKRPPRHPRLKKEKHKLKQEKSAEDAAVNAKSVVVDKSKDYHALVQLDDADLVTNMDSFECPVCFIDIESGEGVVLQECLHTFCKECLASTVQFCETALIKCPFRNDEYSCESHLLEREIKSLVSSEVFERHLQRSMALAESQALDSFHCKTPDCPGWCLFEDNVNIFLCPVCKHTNCLTCAAIHEGKNCRQYQDDVAFRCDSSEEAKKTKEYLEDMLKNGDAMKCPKCQVILMKKWGCDWLKCSMCHTEVCWVTKGPRWGPEGRGDTSGGCKCMVNGVRCHPKCNYCH